MALFMQSWSPLVILLKYRKVLVRLTLLRAAGKNVDELVIGQIPIAPVEQSQLELELIKLSNPRIHRSCWC